MVVAYALGTVVAMFRPGLARKPRLWPGFRQLGLAKIPGWAKAASDSWLWLGSGLSRGPSTDNVTSNNLLEVTLCYPVAIESEGHQISIDAQFSNVARVRVENQLQS